MTSDTSDHARRRARMHLSPQYYAVYLLQSVPRPRSFYVGSTPDPVRRLRQHNGELSAGAYRTKRTGARPWQMAAVVHNFPSKVAALQFEHALQHPYQTRHISAASRVSTSRSGGVSLHHRLANVRLLVTSPFFRRMGLSVLILHRPSADAWNLNKLSAPAASAQFSDFSRFFREPADSNEPDSGTDPGADGASIDNASAAAPPTRRSLADAHHAHLSRAKAVILAAPPPCGVCGRLIDYLPDRVPNLDTCERLDAYLSHQMPLLAVCDRDQCSAVCHLSCLAKDHQRRNEDCEVIPAVVNCVGCKASLAWPDIVRTATHLRHYALRDHIAMSSQAGPSS